jgi:LemA protein
MTYALLALILLPLAGAVVVYNGLVGKRQHVREAWSAIDVQLQRRSALIPSLVEAVKGYAEYERGTLQRVVEARAALGGASSGGVHAAAVASDELSAALQRLFVVAEAYPDLKASERFAQLQRDLADTENLIAAARNYYNGAVEAYNIAVEGVPGILLARPFGFAAAEFFSP